MKKIIYLLPFLLFFNPLNAQFYGNGSFCYDCSTSIETGISISNISGLENSSSKLGFYIGFYSYIPIVEEKLDLRTGFSYTSSGAEVEEFDNPLLIHSLNFPLSVHYRVIPNLQVFAGGELGSNLFGRLPEDTSSDPLDSDFSEVITFLDGNVLVGVGGIFFGRLDVNASYLIGVTDITKSDFTDYKENILRLSVGFTFRESY